jgi:hypothetical protein
VRGAPQRPANYRTAAGTAPRGAHRWRETDMKYMLALVALLLATALLGLPTQSTQAAEFEYVGAKACGKCHKKDKEGEQLGIWEKSEHAKAFKTLGSPKAKEAAQKVGVSGDPQKSEACLVCHTTGYGLPDKRFDKKFEMKDGVQCESCHGPGGEYKSKKTMKKISDERGPDGKGDSPTAKATGLIVPDEKTCKTCHSQEIAYNGKTYKNPSYKDFNFKEKFDKIKHPIPK